MTILAAKIDEQERVRELMEGWAAAARSKNIQALIAHYHPDVVAFDAVTRLQYRGIDEYRKQWELGFSMTSGPMIFELRDLQITAAGELAFCHGLLRCGGTGEDGLEQASWMRSTVCWRRERGAWLVVHEHSSVPFDMENGAGLFQLEP